jgi:hypothetical protein
MNKLGVFVFGQHWFHLASALEAIIENQQRYQEINIYLFTSNMPLLPLDLHHRFPGNSLLGLESPEERVASFLRERIGDKVIIHHVDLTKARVGEVEAAHLLLRECLESDDIASVWNCGMNVGIAIKSHLISKTRDSQPNPMKYQSTVFNAVRTFLRLNHWADENESLREISEVWICNGRPFHERVAREICQRLNKKIRYYEIGGEGTIPKRWILHSKSPHDRTGHQEEIENLAREKGLDYEVINQWIDSRRNPRENPFYHEKDPKRSLQLTEPFIVFFSSSEDEVAAISSDWKSAWKDQINALHALMEVFESQDEYQLVVRVHPNQANKSKSDQKRWESFQTQGKTTVYSQDSLVDSYELLDRAHAVIVYQSTLGVEAAVMGKKLAFLAPTRYDKLIPSPKLEQKPEIARWLASLNSTDESILERQRVGALQWINYMASAGTPWAHIQIRESTNRTVGILKGKSLRPPITIIVITRLFLKVKEVKDWIVWMSVWKR